MSSELLTYTRVDGITVVVDGLTNESLQILLKSEFRVIKENYEIEHGVRGIDDADVIPPDNYQRLLEEISKRNVI